MELEGEEDLYNDLTLGNFGIFDNSNSEIKAIWEKLQKLEEKVEDLNKSVHCDNDRLSKENENLRTNISSLYLTAKEELQRKDRTINELRVSGSNRRPSKKLSEQSKSICEKFSVLDNATKASDGRKDKNFAVSDPQMLQGKKVDASGVRDASNASQLEKTVELSEIASDSSKEINSTPNDANEQPSESKNNNDFSLSQNFPVNIASLSTVSDVQSPTSGNGDKSILVSDIFNTLFASVTSEEKTKNVTKANPPPAQKSPMVTKKRPRVENKGNTGVSSPKKGRRRKVNADLEKSNMDSEKKVQNVPNNITKSSKTAGRSSRRVCDGNRSPRMTRGKVHDRSLLGVNATPSLVDERVSLVNTSEQSNKTDLPEMQDINSSHLPKIEKRIEKCLSPHAASSYADKESKVEKLSKIDPNRCKQNLDIAEQYLTKRRGKKDPDQITKSTDINLDDVNSSKTCKSTKYKKNEKSELSPHVTKGTPPREATKRSNSSSSSTCSSSRCSSSSSSKSSSSSDSESSSSSDTSDANETGKVAAPKQVEQNSTSTDSSSTNCLPNNFQHQTCSPEHHRQEAVEKLMEPSQKSSTEKVSEKCDENVTKSCTDTGDCLGSKKVVSESSKQEKPQMSVNLKEKIAALSQPQRWEMFLETPIKSSSEGSTFKMPFTNPKFITPLKSTPDVLKTKNAAASSHIPSKQNTEPVVPNTRVHNAHDILFSSFLNEGHSNRSWSLPSISKNSPVAKPRNEPELISKKSSIFSPMPKDAAKMPSPSSATQNASSRIGPPLSLTQRTDPYLNPLLKKNAIPSPMFKLKNAISRYVPVSINTSHLQSAFNVNINETKNSLGSSKNPKKTQVAGESNTESIRPTNAEKGNSKRQTSLTSIELSKNSEKNFKSKPNNEDLPHKVETSKISEKSVKSKPNNEELPHKVETSKNSEKSVKSKPNNEDLPHKVETNTSKLSTRHKTTVSRKTKIENSDARKQVPKRSTNVRRDKSSTRLSRSEVSKHTTKSTGKNIRPKSSHSKSSSPRVTSKSKIAEVEDQVSKSNIRSKSPSKNSLPEVANEGKIAKVADQVSKSPIARGLNLTAVGIQSQPSESPKLASNNQPISLKRKCDEVHTERRVSKVLKSSDTSRDSFENGRAPEPVCSRSVGLSTQIVKIERTQHGVCTTTVETTSDESDQFTVDRNRRRRLYALLKRKPS